MAQQAVDVSFFYSFSQQKRMASNKLTIYFAHVVIPLI